MFNGSWQAVALRGRRSRRDNGQPFTYSNTQTQTASWSICWRTGDGTLGTCHGAAAKLKLSYKFWHVDGRTIQLDKIVAIWFSYYSNYTRAHTEFDRSYCIGKGHFNEAGIFMIDWQENEHHSIFRQSQMSNREIHELSAIRLIETEMQQTLGKCRAIKLSIDRNWMLATAKRNHTCSLEQLTHSWWLHPDRFARSTVSFCIVIFIVAFTFSPQMFSMLLFFCSYFRSLSVGHEKRTFHEKNIINLFDFLMHLRPCHILYKFTERRDSDNDNNNKNENRTFSFETISQTEENGRRRRRGQERERMVGAQVHSTFRRLLWLYQHVYEVQTEHTAFASSSFSPVRRLFVCLFIDTFHKFYIFLPLARQFPARLAWRRSSAIPNF